MSNKKINPRLLVFLIFFLFFIGFGIVEKIEMRHLYSNIYTITSTSYFKEDEIIDVQANSTFGFNSSEFHTVVPKNDKYSALLNSENFKSQNCSGTNKHSSAFSGKVQVKMDTFPYKIFLLTNKEFCQMKDEVQMQKIYWLVIFLVSCLLTTIFRLLMNN